jgi:phosphate/sulfate permease
MLNARQAWLLIHIGLGSAFLHGFVAGARVLGDIRTRARPDRRADRGLVIMAVAAWLTVVTGTWTVYAWYRATPASSAVTLAYPKAWLAEHADLAAWHDVGMEWKEHVGWLAPMLATSAAVLVVRHRAVLGADWRARRLTTALISLALAAGLIAAAIGAAINKVAPNQFLGL